MGENVAVTPLGKPDAARDILPAKQPDVFGVMERVPLVPSAIDRAAGDNVGEKLPDAGATMVRERVVVAVREPETPVIVMADVPIGVAQPAVKVSALLPVVGLVPKAAVTPLGRPDAARVTLPVNGLMSVTVMVSVTLLPPSTIDTAEAKGLSVKLPVGLATTVRTTVVFAVKEPEVPVTVIVDVPAVAVLPAVSVSTLLPVVGFVPKPAVTPLGNPDTASVTLPLNGLTSVTAIVSVPLAP